jgi:nucleoside-diphosphate-sugar epimerase
VLGWFGLHRFPLDSEKLEKLVAPAEYSAEKIRRELGWRPRVDLDAALAEVAAARREQQR